jgi:hypothetical protein
MRLAVVAGEELHDPIELGPLLGEERRGRDGPGGLDRGAQARLLGEAQANAFAVESVRRADAGERDSSHIG